MVTKLLLVSTTLLGLSCAAQNNTASTPSLSRIDLDAELARVETHRYAGRCERGAGERYALKDGRDCRVQRVTFDYVARACTEKRACG